jgi:hypothetical protein
MAAVVVEATAATADCSGVSPAQICSEPERDGLAGHEPPGQQGVGAAGSGPLLVFTP